MIAGALIGGLVSFLLVGGVILLAFVWAFRRMLG
jgi:hypothetical protein